jgi:recombination protein RecT
MAQIEKSDPEVAKLRQFQSETIDVLLKKINSFKDAGALTLPSDYSPENALRSAYFSLLRTKNKDNKPALEVCDRMSISNALFEMVTQGLNPAKKQCDFIVRGTELSLEREYFGSIALAKRFNPEIVSIVGNVIYKNDVFKYEVTYSGRKQLLKHEQELENIDNDEGNIKGAYAIITFTNGETHLEAMTMKQIKKSWDQGATKGQSPAHKNFPDQMAIKTVINRVCKPYINASSDAEVVDNKTTPNDANSETIDIASEDVIPDPTPIPTPEVKKEETKKEEPNATDNPLF